MLRCKTCRAYQLVDLLEPERVNESVRKAVRAHVAHCAACRANARRMVSMGRALAPRRVPTAVLRSTHASVMAAVNRKRKAVRRRTMVRWASVAAAVLAIVVLARYAGTGTRPVLVSPAPQTHVSQAPAPSPPSQEPEKPAEPKSPLASAFEQAEGPARAFAVIKGAYEEAAARPEGGDFEEMIALCGELHRRWPDSLESLRAMKLRSRCYTQMAEPKEAREAFVAYADEAGERLRQKLLGETGNAERAEAEATERTAGLILYEAKLLFARNEDNAGLSYGDVLLTRYPGTEPARQARALTGEYCQRIEEPWGAIREYNAIIEAAPESRLAREVMTCLPAAFMDAGQPGKAVATWLKYARTSEDSNGKAMGYLNAAGLLRLRGEEYYPEAARLLRKIVHEYPNSKYVPYARQNLAKLSETRSGRFMETPGKDIIDVLDSNKIPAAAPHPPAPETGDILDIDDGIGILEQ